MENVLLRIAFASQSPLTAQPYTSFPPVCLIGASAIKFPSERKSGFLLKLPLCRVQGDLHPPRIHPSVWTTLPGPFSPNRARPDELEKLRVSNFAIDTSVSRRFLSWPSVYRLKQLPFAFSLFFGTPAEQISFRSVDRFVAHDNDQGENQNAAQSARGGKERRVVID